MLARSAPAIACALVFAAALALRVTGLDYLLPHAPEPDAYVVEQARMLRAGGPAEGEQRAFGKYPHLLARCLALWPAPEPTAGVGDDLAAELAAASAPYVRARRLVAWLSALLVPLTYLLARRFLAPWTSVLAAAFAATSLLHLCFSQQARPHGPLATLVLLALLAAMRVARAPAGALAWLALGLASALALGCLHSGLFVAPALVAAWLWGRERGALRAAWKPALALACTAVALPVFYPFLFDGSAASGLALEAGALAQAGHQVRLEWLDGSGFRVVLAALVENDPLLLALALIGAALAVARLRVARVAPERRAQLQVCLAFALPYLVAVGLFRKSFERFVLPLYPFLACLAAHGAGCMARALTARAGSACARLLAVAVALALLAPGAWLCARYLGLHAQPDTLELAARWLEAHAARASERVLLDPRVRLPLRYPPAEPEAGELVSMYALPWEQHLRAAADLPKAWDIVVGSSREGWRTPGEGVSREQQMQARRAEVLMLGATWALVRGAEIEEGGDSPYERVVRSLCPRVLRITPVRALSDENVPLRAGYQGESLVWRVLATRSWGPSIDVHRLRARGRG